MNYRFFVFVTVLLFSNSSFAQDKTTPAEFLKTLVGKWEGNSKTWFRPGELADESKVTGEFKFMPGDKHLRHSYVGSMKGKKRTGEETIAFNTVRKKYQAAWIDTFHMSYGILYSVGEATENGLTVKGSYSAGKDQPEWGWRTSYELVDKDNLTITSYNIFPDGKEVKAIVLEYKRQE